MKATCHVARASLPHRQSGYLYEVPLIIMVTGVATAFAVPRLPSILAKLVLVACYLVWIGGAYYMLLRPGWQPDTGRRLGRPWAILLFILIVLALGLGIWQALGAEVAP